MPCTVMMFKHLNVQHIFDHTLITYYSVIKTSNNISFLIFLIAKVIMKLNMCSSLYKTKVEVTRKDFHLMTK